MNTGQALSDEETTEALAMYFDWILDNDLVDAMVPFAQFEQWFTELAGRMALCKNHASDFDIDRVEDTQFKISEELEGHRVTATGDFLVPNCLVQ